MSQNSPEPQWISGCQIDALPLLLHLFVGSLAGHRCTCTLWWCRRAPALCTLHTWPPGEGERTFSWFLPPVGTPQVTWCWVSRFSRPRPLCPAMCPDKPLRSCQRLAFWWGLSGTLVSRIGLWWRTLMRYCGPPWGLASGKVLLAGSRGPEIIQKSRQSETEI